MDPLICFAIRELLACYAAHQLTPQEQAAVEHHVATCLDCRTELREWLTLDEWLAQADAALPRDTDTNAARTLAAIHARLDQLPANRALASPTTGYDLEALTHLEGLAGFVGLEGSALSSLHNQNAHDAPRAPITQQAGQSALALYDGSLSTRPPEGAPSRPNPPQLAQRRTPAAVAWASVLVFLTLVTSLFYVLAPQLHPHQNAVTPTATTTATATTPLTPTPQPLSGSWHTAPNLPLANQEEFSKSTPQIGYLCSLLTTDTIVPLDKTEDGGMTWRPAGAITLPSPNAGRTFCGVIIDSNDANDVFVQLEQAPPPAYTLWRSRDGGASWSQLSMPPLYQGWANLVVVGSRIIGLGTDDTSLQSPYGPTCSTDPNATGLHQVNDLYASDDGGKTWTHLGQPLINQGLSITPSWATGRGDAGIGSISPGLLSVGTALFVRTFCFAAPSAGGQSQQTYWTSSDGGQTWTPLPTPDSDLFFTPSTTGVAYGVAVSPGLNGALATAPQILYSRDSGASWTALPSLGSIPLPPHFQPSAPDCVNTCYTHYGTPLVMALPDGTVLAVLTVDGWATAPANDIYVSNVYTIDPQSAHPAWHLFAPMQLGSAKVQFLSNWPLAATKRGLVLWARAASAVADTATERVYLSPLP